MWIGIYHEGRITPQIKVTVHPKQWTFFAIYSPTRHSKLVWLTFFCQTRKRFFSKDNQTTLDPVGFHSFSFVEFFMSYTDFKPNFDRISRWTVPLVWNSHREKKLFTTILHCDIISMKPWVYWCFLCVQYTWRRFPHHPTRFSVSDVLHLHLTLFALVSGFTRWKILRIMYEHTQCLMNRSLNWLHFL